MLLENTELYLKKKMLFASIGSYFVAMIPNHLLPSLELNAVSQSSTYCPFKNIIWGFNLHWD